MHTEWLAQSPLLVLPLVAMFLFLAVFVMAAVKVALDARETMEAAARLPLRDDDGPR
jgi:hypothetical protein